MRRTVAALLVGGLLLGMVVMGVALIGMAGAEDNRSVGAAPTPRSISAATDLAPAPTSSRTSPTPTGDDVRVDADVAVLPITDSQWRTMVATGTWRPGCPAGREQLRRLEVNHWTFEGDVARGALIVNADVADDLAGIFTELFRSKFPIARMEPVERYGGDVYKSLRANNTSAFNCRRPGQINAPVSDSPHANGRAVDINPVQNPWRDPRCTCWSPSSRYARADEGPGVIRAGSPVVELFEARGWIWQNIKVPDYMHFDSGYPSSPVDGTSPIPGPS